MQVGSKLTFVANFLGKTLVVEHEPGRSLVMRTAQWPFPMDTSYAWQATGLESTRMALRNRGFLRFAAPSRGLP